MDIDPPPPNCWGRETRDGWPTHIIGGGGGVERGLCLGALSATHIITTVQYSLKCLQTYLYSVIVSQMTG